VLPSNILPLKDSTKVAKEFTKFFEEHSGLRPSSFSVSANFTEVFQRPPSAHPMPLLNSPNRPDSPIIAKVMTPEEDLKSKINLLQLDVPGKITFDKDSGVPSSVGSVNSISSVPIVLTDVDVLMDLNKDSSELLDGLNNLPSIGLGSFESSSGDEREGSITSSSTASKGWVAPESWAVIPPLVQSALPPQTAENAESNGDLCAVRIYKLSPRQQLSHSQQLLLQQRSGSINFTDNFVQPSVLLACPLNTTALEICTTLTQKYFTSYDSSRYRLYVWHGGVERMLAKDEQPLLLQQLWLKEIGYTEVDEICKLGREDHSYLFRFVFREVPVKNKVANDSSTDKLSGTSKSKSKITPRTAILAEENLSVIPVALYKNATTLECLDLSKNTLLDLPEDFFENLTNLRMLALKQNSLYSVPPAIFCLQKLTHLNLSQNNLSSNVVKYLAKLVHLSQLDLSCNQLDSVPASFSALKQLVTLNLSTNKLTAFPHVVLEFKSLRDLNLSFNSICAIPDGIESLQNLRTLCITGNALTYISPKISNLRHLRLIELGGNLCQDLSGILHLPSLVELEAQYNNLAHVTDVSWKYMASLRLENNGLTHFALTTVLLNTKVINLSSCKLATLPDNFFQFLPNIHTATLDRNQLLSLPSSINSAANRLTSVDLQFSKLINLKRLDLHGNNLKSLHSEIWNAPMLASLNLSSNFLTGLPDSPPSFEALPLALSLSELYLSDNRFTSESLYNVSLLRRLSVLNLSLNSIVDLEENLNSMTKLVELYLSDNELTRLPDDIDKCSNLRVLHLNGNRFMSLSWDLCRNSALEVLDVSGNKLKYNISNWPYDWNWAWNVELKSLNLSDNRKLEIRPPLSSSQPSSSRAAHSEKSLFDFRNLIKLRYLNVAHVNIAPESIPIETTTLRVQQNWHATPADYPIVGLSSWCGRKQVFDTYDIVYKRFLGQSDCHLFGLFSGRGECLVSIHLYETFAYDLEAEIIKYKEKEATREKEDNVTAPVEDTSSTDNANMAILRRAFLNCNRRLSTQPSQVRVGSTALVVYIVGSVAYVANVGDTMAVLSREGSAINLSTRHHPWSRNEIERIRELGGYVSGNGLVAGELDITRAFGYFHLLPCVNANPTMSCTVLTERDEFIILASYELWRFISYQMAVDLVRQYRSDVTYGAYKLRDLAISYGASGSITVMVVDLASALMAATTANMPQPESGRKPTLRPDLRIADQSLKRLEQEIDPPTGEVTLVFTDIKDSTTLWELYPMAMHVALRIHDDILRRSLRRIGGYEVKTEGDSFMVSFATVQTALKWCCAVQKELIEADWPQEIVDSPICPVITDPNQPGQVLFRGPSVRMGMHVGLPFYERNPVTERMDYTGPVVNFTARVASAPTGGQLFVTPQVMEKYHVLSQGVKDDIGSLRVFDMGVRTFKGFEKAERLFAVYPEPLPGRHELLLK